MIRWSTVFEEVVADLGPIQVSVKSGEAQLPA